MMKIVWKNFFFELQTFDNYVACSMNNIVIIAIVRPNSVTINLTLSVREPS